MNSSISTPETPWKMCSKCFKKSGMNSSISTLETPWSSLVPVPANYSVLGCDIPEVSWRGISIEQLEELGTLIEKVFSNDDFEHIDEFTHQKVTKETVNLYHVNNLFAMPLSEKYQCSYVEMVANGPQLPTFFVSHWWGTPFFDTLRMLRLHAKQRNVQKNEYYWICTFANCQHNLEELSPDDYLDTPFAKAIMNDKCRGTVLVLNEKDATPFTRSWCVFEAYISTTYAKAKEHRHLMDVTTIIPDGDCEQSGGGTFNERCAGLLYELTEQDEDKEEREGKFTIRVDETSDHPGDPDMAWFPSHVSKLGVQVDIRNASASRESDQRNIMKWIGDQADKVNTVMRRKFLRPAIYMAATEFGDPKYLQELIEGGLVSIEEAVAISEEEGCLADACEYVENANYRDNEGCVKYLLELGCDPNRRNYDGKLAFEFVFEYGNYHHARHLLKFNADPLLAGKSSIKCISTDEIPKDVLKMLQKSGMNI